MYSRSTKRVLFAVLALAPLATIEAQSLNTNWSNALRFTSDDKAIDVKLGGRIHNDWAAVTADDTVERRLSKDFEDGNEFRRARLYVSGKLHGVFFKAQYDFEDGVADFKDVFMGLETPAGRFKAGQFKEGFSLEELTSSNNVTFMERSLHNSFSPTRNSGFQLDDTVGEGNRLYWAVGVFRDTDAFGESKGDGEYNFTARLAGQPLFADGGKELIHVGVSVSVRNPNDNEYRVKDNREVHLSPNLADTTAIASNGVLLANLEAAWVRGPLSVQGEYAIADVNTPSPMGDPTFHGGYVAAAFTLTGESRRYKQSAAVFGTIKPDNPWNGEHGGAWEVALRYSMLDLTDGLVTGGELSGLTAGLNWYLNSNARVMLNFSHQDLASAGAMKGGSVQAVQMRFQVNF